MGPRGRLGGPKRRSRSNWNKRRVQLEKKEGRLERREEGGWGWAPILWERTRDKGPRAERVEDEWRTGKGSGRRKEGGEEGVRRRG